MENNGQYTKLRHLGKGNMGVVHLVKRNSDGKVLVMKLIDLTKMDRKERTASLNEARVLGSLSHPNVVTYVESFLAKRNDTLCIVMEFAEGGDISAKIKMQRGVLWSEDHILDWFIQICLGVHFCHRKRVLHRDIKTQNIFLTSQGVAKVGDFGISRVLVNTMDVAHTFVGTPYYLSPEVVQEKPYDMKSDVWALGVVLYELMTLKHPFNALDMKGLMYKIMRAQFEAPPAHYSSELRGLVSKMLVKDPKGRLTVTQILETPIIKARLAKWASGQTSLPSSYLADLRQCGVFGEQESENEAPVHAPALPPRKSEVSAQQDAFRQLEAQKDLIFAQHNNHNQPGKIRPIHSRPSVPQQEAVPIGVRRPLGNVGNLGPNIRVDAPHMFPKAYGQPVPMPSAADAKRDKELEAERERQLRDLLLHKPPSAPASSSPRSMPGHLPPLRRQSHQTPVRKSHPEPLLPHRPVGYAGRLPPVSPTRGARVWR